MCTPWPNLSVIICNNHILIKKSCYDSSDIPNKDRNFNPRTMGKCFYFVICISRHWFQTKLLPYIA